MRFRKLALAAALLLGSAAHADPAPGFTPAQREEIVRILHQALQSDPTILRDAITALQLDDEAREKAQIRALSVNSHDPSAGNPVGDVTIVEFYDPRCPYCRSVHDTVDALVRGDHGIRLLYKDIPVLGPASDMESRAILAARNQGGYLKMQAALMGDPTQPTDDFIRKTASSIGLNADRLMTDMNAPEIHAQIDANLRLARRLHVEGTPVFFVGDQALPGAVSMAQLQTAVADARKHPT